MVAHELGSLPGNGVTFVLRNRFHCVSDLNLGQIHVWKASDFFLKFSSPLHGGAMPTSNSTPPIYPPSFLKLASSPASRCLSSIKNFPPQFSRPPTFSFCTFSNLHFSSHNSAHRHFAARVASGLSPPPITTIDLQHLLLCS